MLIDKARDMLPENIDNLTGREVIDLLQSDSLLARISKIFSMGYAEIEQASMQRRPPSPIELRRMDIKVAARIVRLFAVSDAMPGEARDER